ncbi:MAG TPA: hypothetical protein VHF70_09115 [Rubrobacteraceae bacterium]|jgi:hypothetical protein|nr:hypothetical protein [Rubrobacteraceae bacterium]
MKMPGHSAWYLVGIVRAAASGRSFVAAERHRAASQVWPSALAVVCPWGAA